MLFTTSFSTRSAKFTEFDSRNYILFQIKGLSRNIKETQLPIQFVKVTARPNLTQFNTTNHDKTGRIQGSFFMNQNVVRTPVITFVCLVNEVTLVLDLLVG